MCAEFLKSGKCIFLVLCVYSHIMLCLKKYLIFVCIKCLISSLMFTFFHIMANCYINRCFYTHPSKKTHTHTHPHTPNNSHEILLKISFSATGGMGDHLPSKLNSNVLRGYCTPGPYFWKICIFSQKIKQLLTKCTKDLIRNLPRYSKIAVLFQ